MSSRLPLLRAHILLKQSYVCLRLDSHSEALRFAKEVLDMQGKGSSSTSAGDSPSSSSSQQQHPILPAGVVSLARLYAGESLVFLDRISEVITTFSNNKKLLSSMLLYSRKIKIAPVLILI